MQILYIPDFKYTKNSQFCLAKAHIMCTKVMASIRLITAVINIQGGNWSYLLLVGNVLSPMMPGRTEFFQLQASTTKEYFQYSSPKVKITEEERTEKKVFQYWHHHFAFVIQKRLFP